MNAFKIIDTPHIMHNNSFIYYLYYLQIPRSEPECLQIASDFEDQLNFVISLEAHQWPPANSILYYYKYKNKFSIVLIPLVDCHIGSHMWT